MDPNVANTLLTSNVYLDNQKVLLHKDNRDPLRCVKCQLCGHIVNICKQNWDACGICGLKHRSNTCTEVDPAKMRCVACNTSGHLRTDRVSPSLLSRLEALDRRDPERLLP
ncbi:hypothetical protein CPB86DRAFT_717570, partial [Serendipita vermifera]